MTEKLPKPEPDDAETERRFSETLGRLVNTQHKPRKDEPPKPRGKAD